MKYFLKSIIDNQEVLIIPCDDDERNVWIDINANDQEVYGFPKIDPKQMYDFIDWYTNWVPDPRKVTL